MCDLDMDIDTTLLFTRHVLIQKYFVFSHAFVIMFTLSISLLLLHFNTSSSMNSVSDTCKLSYFMIIKLLVCNSTAALAYMIKFFLLNFCLMLGKNIGNLLAYLLEMLKIKRALLAFKPNLFNCLI